MELLAQREEELGKIYKYSGRTFLGLYMVAGLGSCITKGRLPFFSTFVKHSILSITGTFCTAAAFEKVGAELYYNQLLIQLSDKYNFTPEEVIDLQRNLSQYYIRKDREAEMAKE
mmetsp:Transcript_15614/g.26379  ORF Transcript_15614/g.26379 Transcript_15614/m.26379 type:complete len:115 (-) Transcript_15614:72-416(-)